MHSLIINQPDDWHVHFRDGNLLNDTVNATAKHFARALVMPNLKPALTSINQLLNYRERIINACSPNYSFSPMMTFYLNEQIKPEELIASKPYSFIVGAKLYPAGATTNSDEGVQSLQQLYPLFEIMQQQDMVLQIHGEVATGDIFEREESFLIDYLAPIIANFPKLRVVLEHISTQKAVEFVKKAPANVAATITPHHLLYNRNHLLAGGIRPHYYCLPILKHQTDQIALLDAATSGNPKFFAGTDSAPHSINSKENACGCAGIYSAPFAVPLYAQVFENAYKLSALNKFLSVFGADFYQLSLNKEKLTLIKEKQLIPEKLTLGNDFVVPIAASEFLLWSVHEIA